MLIKYPICLVKGHVINPSETIINGMIDKRNWLCKCHRCGLYVMHDGAISGGSVVLTEDQAFTVKWDIEAEMKMMERYGYTDNDD